MVYVRCSLSSIIHFLGALVLSPSPQSKCHSDHQLGFSPVSWLCMHSLLWSSPKVHLPGIVHGTAATTAIHYLVIQGCLLHHPFLLVHCQAGYWVASHHCQECHQFSASHLCSANAALAVSAQCRCWEKHSNGLLLASGRALNLLLNSLWLGCLWERFTLRSFSSIRTPAMWQISCALIIIITVIVVVGYEVGVANLLLNAFTVTSAAAVLADLCWPIHDKLLDISVICVCQFWAGNNWVCMFDFHCWSLCPSGLLHGIGVSSVGVILLSLLQACWELCFWSFELSSWIECAVFLAGVHHWANWSVWLCHTAFIDC